ncbi:MAG: nicotinate-nucleotide adenylyltransferase [Acidaminococcaceae bacterium]|nr:nicotinate-nucleotide adenylyltransferase [Acidaminococcaceae bacterium]
MERLAIMGGTFDPIHIGHLRMTHAVQRQLKFDKVVFLPAYIPPHKQTRSDFASWQDRLAMVKLAVQNYADFVVSSLEFDRGGISYTYDTVNFMQELWPDAEIYLIIGEDSLTQLFTWYRVQDLLRLVHFVAAERPGYEGEEGVARLTKAYGSWTAEKIIHAEVPETAISSTEIRKRLREGKPIRGMVPMAVEQYIYENGLYQQEK